MSKYLLLGIAKRNLKGNSKKQTNMKHEFFNALFQFVLLSMSDYKNISTENDKVG